MRKSLLAVAVVGGLLAGCSQDASVQRTAQVQSEKSPEASIQTARHGAASIASLPDRGSLLAYDRTQAPVRRGAYTWHPAQLSEAYALRAIADGSMRVTGPAGQPIQLQYERHVEHPDGNWTWIGRVAGAGKGAEAILTFGKDAVFGTIANGTGAPLQVTTASGRTWVVEADQAMLAAQPRVEPTDTDFLASPAVTAALQSRTHGAPTASAVHAMMAAGAVAQPAAAVAQSTVDIVVGYTTGFATRLGGQSQAITRLNSMIDIANQAYANSEVAAQLRLVKAIQVDYADNTANRTALLELSGQQCTNASGTGTQHLPDADVNCTAAAVPAALQPLVDAREQSLADLAVLVRTFQSPENQSCGVAWLLGGGQQPIDGNSAKLAYSVVSDSSGQAFPDPDNGATCRDETLAHELGHNMGLAHDRTSAARSDGILQASEYGRFADSFGYSTAADAGNFYTIMAIPQAGQTGFRVFSDPRVTFCGGLPCGVAGQEDNARTLSITMPIIAAFRGPPVANTWLRGDFDGDGRSDILWRNPSTGANTVWKSGNSQTSLAVTSVGSGSWVASGAADFDGDGKADILWHNTSTGQNVIWKTGNSATSQAVNSTGLDWKVAGAGDFDGDGKADILWRNASTGANVLWKSGNAATSQTLTSITDQAWFVAGVADFDGDGRSDILWRNSASGSNTIWRSGNSAARVGMIAVTGSTWYIVGVGDFDGDGKADILWRNIASGQDSIWKSGNYATQQAVTTVTSQAWIVAGVGDFDGDHKADILWHNLVSGQTTIWKSGNYATQQPVTTVTNLAWTIVG
jgi:hypothetical protein